MFDELVQEPENNEVETQVEQAPDPVKPIESPAERNFRELEKAKLRAERERDEAVKYAREMQQSQQKPVQQQPDEDDITIGNDELVEGKHFKKMNQQYKQMKNELNETRRQLNEQSAELKLKMKYPDFDKVVNSDTINALKEKDYDVYSAISATGDTYKQAILAYNSIKSNGLYHSDPVYDHEKQLAQKNVLKPRPMASVNPQQGDSPLSRANAFAQGLTPDLAEQLRKEMYDASKNRQ